MTSDWNEQGHLFARQCQYVSLHSISWPHLNWFAPPRWRNKHYLKSAGGILAAVKGLTGPPHIADITYAGATILGVFSSRPRANSMAEDSMKVPLREAYLNPPSCLAVKLVLQAGRSRTTEMSYRRKSTPFSRARR